MKSYHFYIVILSFIFNSGTLTSATITVTPGNSIQDAIDKAENNDKILVEYGTYNESLQIRGKNIIFKGKPNSDGKYPKLNGNNTQKILYMDNQGANTITQDTKIKKFRFVNGYTTTEGGAIEIRDGASPKIAKCTFKKNNSTKSGGAISILENSQTLINHCIFKKNEAVNEGGGVFIFQAQATIKNSTIKSNSTTGTSKSEGGGIYAGGNQTSVTIQSCAIQNNTTNIWGGGIHLTQVLSALIENCEIYENTATRHSGGITVDTTQNTTNTETIIQNNLIYRNTCHEIGAGLYIEKSNNVQLISNEIYENQVTDETSYTGELTGGGFVYFYSNGIIQNNNIHDNTSESAGAFSVENSTATIKNNLITDNQTTQHWPGMKTNLATVTMQYNLLKNNILASTGDDEHQGSFFFQNSTVNFSSNLVINNSDIGHWNQSSGSMINNTFAKNKNDFFNEDGIIMYNATLDIANNIFYKNGGTALKMRLATTANIYNNNFFGNNGISEGHASINALNLEATAASNTDIDPQLANESDYQLQSNSTLVDSGTSAYSLPDYDYDGDTRIRNNQVDIGAQEF